MYECVRVRVFLFVFLICSKCALCTLCFLTLIGSEIAFFPQMFIRYVKLYHFVACGENFGMKDADLTRFFSEVHQLYVKVYLNRDSQ
jgi:hypothetical protein